MVLDKCRHKLLIVLPPLESCIAGMAVSLRHSAIDIVVEVIGVVPP